MQIADFPLFVDGMSVISTVATTTSAGAHVVSETSNSGYAATFGGDCDSAGNVTVPPGGSASCTITNDDKLPTTGTLTITKIVENDNQEFPGTLGVGDFPLFVDSMSVTSAVATTTSAGAHVVSETSDPNYTGTFGGDCDGAGNVSVPAGGSANCTITNNDNPPT